MAKARKPRKGTDPHKLDSYLTKPESSRRKKLLSKSRHSKSDKDFIKTIGKRTRNDRAKYLRDTESYRAKTR